MKAIVLNEFGPASVLQLADVPTPTPGPDDVVVGVRAVSVNRTLDLVVRAGRYAKRPILPHVLGADPGGVITAVGSNVTERKVGDRVVCGPIVGKAPNGAPLLLGVDIWGGYAEYVGLPWWSTRPIPDGLDFETAVVVGRHGPLAFTQLRDRAQVKAGEWVLVMAAAGALGSVAVQAAKYLGTKVIAAAGSEDRVAAALRLGADFGVNYRAADLTGEVRRITGGSGVDVVLENVSDPEQFGKALAATGFRGRLVTAGAHGGGTVPLDVKHLYLNRITIFGDPVETNENYEMAMAAAAQGQLKVLIDQVLPLAQASRAHEIADSRDQFGKILLTPLT